MDPIRNIFAIYASQDSGLALNLLRRMKLLEADLNVSIWQEDPIYPGQSWNPQDTSRLDQADIFLLLVSDAFMHSEFVKQDEFKMIIDRYKEGKSIVIPVILDDCPWDIDFDFDDYNFSLKELQVLPKGGKPISAWNLAEQPLKHVTDHVSGIITSFAENLDQEKPNENLEKKTAKIKNEEQIALNFIEEKEADRKVKEEKIFREEVESKKRADEDKRLKEEAMAKERFEEENKRLEEAESKRVAQADKLRGEAEAKKRVEEEKKLREQAEADRIAQEEKQLKEQVEAKEREEEEKRLKEEAEAKRRAEAEKRLKEEAEIKRRAKEEKWLGKEVEAKNNVVEERSIAEEAYRSRQAADSTANVEEESITGRNNRKKGLLRGFLVAGAVIAGIWAFSVFTTDSKKNSPTAPDMNITEVDSNALDNAKPDSRTQAGAVLKLGIGDTFKGDIIFTIDSSNKTGKITHPKDAGPMTWNEAMNIHEQLGEGWRLPNLEELQLMYQTIGQGATNKGQFADELYWSATPFDKNQARLVRFSDGNTSYHYNSTGTHRKFRVRAVRDFER